MVNFGTTATCEGDFASGSKGREEKRGIKEGKFWYYWDQHVIVFQFQPFFFCLLHLVKWLSSWELLFLKRH